MGESLRLAASRGERPNLAIGHLRFAELLGRKGDSAEAREQLTKATALFLDMEMTWWLEQAEKLGKSLGSNSVSRPDLSNPPA